MAGMDHLLKNLLGVDPKEIRGMADAMQKAVASYDANMCQTNSRLKMIMDHLGIEEPSTIIDTDLKQMTGGE